MKELTGKYTRMIKKRDEFRQGDKQADVQV